MTLLFHSGSVTGAGGRQVRVACYGDLCVPSPLLRYRGRRLAFLQVHSSRRLWTAALEGLWQRVTQVPSVSLVGCSWFGE